MSKQNRIELSHWTSTESMFHLHRKFSVKQFTEVEATNYYRLIFYQITKLEYMYNLLLCKKVCVKLLFYLLQTCNTLSFFFKVPLCLTQKNEFFRGTLWLSTKHCCCKGCFGWYCLNEYVNLKRVWKVKALYEKMSQSTRWVEIL